jgi:hypothetical protein
VFLLNSRFCHFTETIRRWHPFYRRYGANLPSSLERFNSRALEYSSRIPVSVYGTGDLHSNLIAFLGSCFMVAQEVVTSSSGISKPYTTPHLRTMRIVASRSRNINRVCIDYALRPRLSSRLTLGGRAFPRKPYPYGDTNFDRIYRYSCPDYHFQPLHGRSPLPLQCCWNAFLPLFRVHSFGLTLESRSFSAQTHSMGQLLRFV